MTLDPAFWLLCVFHFKMRDLFFYFEKSFLENSFEWYLFLFYFKRKYK